MPPMTDRGLPIVDGAPACPFVAYEDDRDGRGQAPDHRHRCFAEPRPAPRALAHQEAYCLSSAFPVCPTFQDWARREAATARALAEREEPSADDPSADDPPMPESMPAAEPAAYQAPDIADPADADDLPPRRNPPRAWAAPPPWAGEGSGEPVPPPPFLSDRAYDRPPDRSPGRDAEAAAWGAASRGLAGSAADRLAGPYSDEPDLDLDRHAYGGPPVSADPYALHRTEPDAYEPDPYERPAAAPPTGPERASASPAYDRPVQPASRPGSPTAQPAAGPRPNAGPRPQPQDPAELFGPAWERPRKYEAYPSLRTRVGIPSIGSPSRVGVAAIALVLAAAGLFFIGPMLLGVGSNNTPGPGATTTPAPGEATPTPLPTKRPDPTPQTYIVAKGDTVSKIARKFDITVEQLLAANPKIKNPNRIGIGDEIVIPVPQEDAGAGEDEVSAAP
jgi:hypothetical protein